MSDQKPSDVLGGLPRSRPHRRSEKRPARPAQAARASLEAPNTPTASSQAPRASKPKPKATAERPPATSAKAARPRPAAKSARPQPAQPGGTPEARRRPAPTPGHEILGTAVQAAAELAEIGLSASARAIRRAVSRLPRP